MVEKKDEAQEKRKKPSAGERLTAFLKLHGYTTADFFRLLKKTGYGIRSKHLFDRRFARASELIDRERTEVGLAESVPAFGFTFNNKRFYIAVVPYLAKGDEKKNALQIQEMGFATGTRPQDEWKK